MEYKLSIAAVQKHFNYKEVSNFNATINAIRLDIVRFLYNLFIFVMAIGFVIYLYYLIFDRHIFERNIISFLAAFNTIGLAAFTIIRLNLNTNNYGRYFLTIMIFLSMAAVLIALSTGVYSPIVYPLVIVCILGSSIVYGLKKATIYTICITLVLFAIAIGQGTELIPITPDNTDSDIDNVIIYTIFMGIVLNMARIAYNQIEESYLHAATYSKQLTKLNNELDKIVRLRTKKLQENYNKQIESTYKTALFGKIARSVIHDITTPLSSIQGTLELIDHKKRFDNELVDLSMNSLSRINEIIESSRELMKGHKKSEIFDVGESVNSTLKLISNEIYSSDIDLKILYKPGYLIKGDRSFFERVIINLAVNAVEELKAKKSDRKLRVSIKNLKKFGKNDERIIVEVEDNGRGIPEDVIEDIFKEEISLKTEGNNLGLGLPFVKEIIEKDFGGDITAKSKIGSYTKMVISLDAYHKNGHK